MSEFAQAPGFQHAPGRHRPQDDASGGPDERARAREVPGDEEGRRGGTAEESAPGPLDGEAGPPEEERPQKEAGPGAGSPRAGEEPEDGPRPLGVGLRPTGHASLDERLRRLEDADHLAVSAHQEVYEDVHRGLRETLAALDRPHTPRS